MCLCIVRACACVVAISCTWAILNFITFAAGPVKPTVAFSFRRKQFKDSHVIYITPQYGSKLCQLHINKHKSEYYLLPVQDALGPIYRPCLSHFKLFGQSMIRDIIVVSRAPRPGAIDLDFKFDERGS